MSLRQRHIAWRQRHFQWSELIHWLIQSLDDCPLILGSAMPEWLSEQEQQRTFKAEKRRRDWLLGRWTAKNLVQRHLAETTGETVPLAALTIGNDEDGAPYCEVLREACCVSVGRLPISLTISHSHGHSLCALCLESDANTQHGTRYSLGCDIERIEPREPNFVSSFFAAEEMALVGAAGAGAEDVLTTAIWSAKESVLKAIRTGLRTDTRRLSCRVEWTGATPTAWTPFGVTLDAPLPASFQGFGQVGGGYMRTSR